MATKKNKKDQVQRKPGIAAKIKEFRDFLDQSKTEMKKVTYPSQKQTLLTSASVLFLVFVIALFLGVVDIALAKIMEVILP